MLTTVLVGALAIVLALGCEDATTQPSASVRFVMVAPFCGTVLPVQLSIDGQLVATDTFRIHLVPAHEQSRDFPVAAGRHLVGARVVGGLVWPDTSVTIAPGATFADSLGFYCS